MEPFVSYLLFCFDSLVLFKVSWVFLMWFVSRFIRASETHTGLDECNGLCNPIATPGNLQVIRSRELYFCLASIFERSSILFSLQLKIDWAALNQICVQREQRNLSERYRTWCSCQSSVWAHSTAKFFLRRRLGAVAAEYSFTTRYTSHSMAPFLEV